MILSLYFDYSKVHEIMLKYYCALKLIVVWKNWSDFHVYVPDCKRIFRMDCHDTQL